MSVSFVGRNLEHVENDVEGSRGNIEDNEIGVRKSTLSEWVLAKTSWPWLFL